MVLIDRAIFLAVIAIIAAVFLWMLYGCQSANSEKEDLNKILHIGVGDHLLKIGETHHCGFSVTKNGFDLLLFDDTGNENAITLKNNDLMISYTRIEGEKKIVIIDYDGDGLPDLRAIYEDGKLITKHKLKIDLEEK